MVKKGASMRADLFFKGRTPAEKAWLKVEKPDTFETQT